MLMLILVLVDSSTAKISLGKVGIPILGSTPGTHLYTTANCWYENILTDMNLLHRRFSA